MTGQPSALDVVTTREVRWFATGPIPPEVRDWFTASHALVEGERRVDRYDPVSARFGVGVKQRNAESLEAKFLLASRPPVRFAERMEGRVEDWLKVGKPIRDMRVSNGTYLEIKKDKAVRRYAVAGGAGSSGCEVELTAISARDVPFWTLCFETFGGTDDLEEALRAGIDGVLGETPLPESLALTIETSFGYPEWIDRRLTRASSELQP